MRSTVSSSALRPVARRSKQPARLRGWLHAVELLVLWGFAVAQPLYDLLARQAGFLVAHRVVGIRLPVLAAVLSLALPAMLALLVALLHRCSARLGHAVHLTSIGLLMALATLQTMARVENAPAWTACLVAAAMGLAAVATYQSYATARLLLRMAAPAVIIFPVAFLASGSVSRLLRTAAITSGPFPPVASDVPVVVVVFDELPLTSLLDERHRIDRRHFPHFAALADQATWFRNASGVHQLSEHAVPAIVTGCWPDTRCTPTAGDHPLSLFSLLASSYELHVSEAFTQLCPERPRAARDPWRRDDTADGLHDVSLNASREVSLCELTVDLLVVYAHLVVPPDWRGNLPSIAHTWRGFTGVLPRFTGAGHAAPGDYGRRAAQMRRFIASIRPSSRPTLHFLHVLLPHVPWSYTAGGRLYLPENAMCVPGLKLPAEMWCDDAWFVRQALQRYRQQLIYVDRLLGCLLDRLRACGLYDRSLIVVTADHGAAFVPGGSRRDPAATARPEDILAVPLFIKRPGQRQGTISDRNVQAIDILPTIAEALSIQLPWPIDGRSAWNRGLPERPMKRMVNARGLPVELPGRLSLQSLFHRSDSAGDSGPAASADSRGDSVSPLQPPRPNVNRPVTSIELEDRLRGQPVSACRVDGQANAAGQVRLAPELVRWQQLYGARFVPALVLGTLHSAHTTFSEQTRVVVALNGIIRAVAPPSRQGTAAWGIAALLPPELLKAGRNRLEMFAARPDPRAAFGVRLQRLRVEPNVLIAPARPEEPPAGSAGPCDKSSAEQPPS